MTGRIEVCGEQRGAGTDSSQYDYTCRGPGHRHKSALPVLVNDQHLAGVLRHPHIHHGVRDMPELRGECGDERNDTTKTWFAEERITNLMFCNLRYTSRPGLQMNFFNVIFVTFDVYFGCITICYD